MPEKPNAPRVSGNLLLAQVNDIESIPDTFVNFTFIFFCFSQILKNGLRFENGAEITYESHDDITKKPGTKAFNSFRFHALSTNITNLGNLENLVECRFSALIAK